MSNSFLNKKGRIVSKLLKDIKAGEVALNVYSNPFFIDEVQHTSSMIFLSGHQYGKPTFTPTFDYSSREYLVFEPEIEFYYSADFENYTIVKQKISGVSEKSKIEILKYGEVGNRWFLNKVDAEKYLKCKTEEWIREYTERIKHNELAIRENQRQIEFHESKVIQYKEEPPDAESNSN